MSEHGTRCPSCGRVILVDIDDTNRRRLAEAEARSVRLEMELRNCTASLQDRLAENGGLAIRLIAKEKAVAELVDCISGFMVTLEYAWEPEAVVAASRKMRELIAKRGGAL